MRNLTALSKLAIALIASLALASCGGATGGEATTAPPATIAPPATAAAAAPTSPPPVEATPVPTAAPQQPAEPAPPTPTLEPLASNTIPEDGQSFDDELPFNTQANDPAVGPNSGDGIKDVTFQFYGPDGQLIFSHTEVSTLYCAFGGGDDGENCDRWIFSEHDNKWPNGRPAASGPHRLLVTIRGERGGTKQDQRSMTLNLSSAQSEPTPTLEPLVSNSFPTGDTFGDELAFQTTANDPSVGGDNGAGIASVTFRIVDSQGRKVYERTEQSPLYCAFGGGDNGQDCTVWRFSAHDNKWPGGVPVENGEYYRLQVTVNAKSGRQTKEELKFQIQL